MAYDKHVWTCGEAITTEKLNHMEDGIASGGAEPIVGSIATDNIITFSDDRFNNQSLVNVQAGFLTWSDALNSPASATPLTIDELKAAIESGADVSADLVIGDNTIGDIHIPLHLYREKYNRTNISLTGMVMDTFPSSSGTDGSGYIIYAEVIYDTAWHGEVIWRTDIQGK